ncbi:hypothetical protein KW807_02395 [Candidatus Parcubacteria bacterium]|nr:hypothetical protein [Candidatus Parcubacteria bacterium]
MAAQKTKKPRLKDLSNEQLVSKYTVAVRFAWEERRSQKKHPGHNSLYQQELASKRELLRRLNKLEGILQLIMIHAG